ncbi:glycyl-radical enzyme activating protein [Desulfotignum balticum]|uniref:glycyl-radical enzyme activating protein n=1 Tax=Desulfotignum balticum TaxID=115781 RepID=UPI00040DEB21|nr:glycyl-radical enzyme activating protein [Desulfotignum balticum]
MEKGIIFDIKNFSIHDGPGIRTTVFLKGCPLRCLWCSNPESQKVRPELMMYPEKCVGCGKCVEVCPTGAAEATQTIREKCKGCGKCVEVCEAEARKLIGRWATSEDIVEEVAKDKIFYDESDGGVTLSGGEVVMQPKFATEIFKMCQEQGIHTVLDTTGYCKWEIFSEIIRYVDLVYFDNKCIIPEQHMKLTGVDNGMILTNLKKMDEVGKPFSVRMPIIPSLNDSEEILQATGEFLRELKSNFTVFLLPFHAYGASKYERLDLTYKLGKQKNLGKEKLEPIKNILEEYGLKVQLQ